MRIARHAVIPNVVGWLIICSIATGCAAQGNVIPEIATSDIPRELEKASLPEYRVEPPDILLIAAVHNIRPPGDKLRAGDVLEIRATNLLPTDPQAEQTANEFKIINGMYRVQSDGTLDLGPEYGSARVEGLTLAQAREAINVHLRDGVGLANPKTAVSMPDVAGKQEISGEHLVRIDGTIALGVYGSVHVAGRTLPEIKGAIEAHLAQHIHEPEVDVDVAGYNSKVVYVITDGGGMGEQVVRIPVTGNETVLDAVAQIQGLSDVSSRRIWVARPGPADLGCAQTMIVDWRGITQEGITTTNYQLFPGDRIYIQAYPLVHVDSFIARAVSPMNRVLGTTMLGASTVRIIKNINNTGGGFF
jgi:polysaccharide export outer membrane protein